MTVGCAVRVAASGDSAVDLSSSQRQRRKKCVRFMSVVQVRVVVYQADTGLDVVGGRAIYAMTTTSIGALVQYYKVAPVNCSFELPRDDSRVEKD